MCGSVEVSDEYAKQALAAEILCQLLDKQSVAFLNLEEARKADGSGSGIRRLDWEEVKKGYREIYTVISQSE